ncbi:MAG: 2-(3-amino-3-carboxypropyl)histidine synthase [Candidatus Argoarchaeum ethanivorans]|uniref:2-(3-amino-3-carboxypropyl)histidine synthase n=1 Tax=Candidatus Argoarchaeum ethanivorans TaxID=2608793 RepID=A0A811T9S1_9EURY|nr:MAG: 2-(3-amino-3-carboxypropyl)histidine synthase [Candidatus Argoarchaeum ethanivorans]
MQYNKNKNKEIIYTIDDLEIDIQLILNVIDEREAATIGLQFPEGLKRQAVNISRIIQQHRRVEVLISGNPCFGACDIDTRLIELTDVLFHFGHSSQGFCKEVVYVEARSKIDVAPVVARTIKILSGKRIGIITTVQHVHKLQEIQDMLAAEGFECVIEEGDAHIAYPGQVLGCNFSAAGGNCDEYIYVGGGEFHPTGVSIATRKNIIIANPYNNSVYKINPEPLIRRRCAMIAKAFDAANFGIIVSTKIGQERLALARALKRKIEEHNKNADLIIMDLVTPEQLLGFKPDAFVNTACPRIAIDDSKRFNIPVLTPVELEILIGEREWKEFAMDEILAGDR